MTFLIGWWLIGILTMVWVFVQVWIARGPNYKWTRDDYMYVPVLCFCMSLLGPILLGLYLYNDKWSKRKNKC